MTQTIGGVTRTVQCNGSLRVVAQKVTVEGDDTGNNGIITASGLRSTPGSGPAGSARAPATVSTARQAAAAAPAAAATPSIP